ncbi:MAG: TIGR02996 domain-containing protein [Polyangiaceae bacterium]
MPGSPAATNETLEAAILSAPTEVGPFLAYSDWLAEQGREREAHAYRLLGGVLPREDAPLAGELECALLVVASAFWVVDCARGPANMDQPGAEALMLAVAKAREALTNLEKSLTTRAAFTPPPELASLDPHIPAPARAVLDAIYQLSRAVAGESVRASLEQALRAVRAEVAWPALKEVLELALGGSSAPLTADKAVTKSLSKKLSRKDVATAFSDAEKRDFTFAKVMITNATQGVEGASLPAEPTTKPMVAFCQLAAASELDASDYADMEPAERVEWFTDELFSDPPVWSARSYFGFLSWVFTLRAENEGEELRVGPDTHRPLVEELASFGRYVGGAETEDEFPFSFFQFERRAVLSRLIY